MRKFPFYLIVVLALLTAGSTQAQKKNIKKPALMWFDGEANFQTLSQKDSIDYYLEKIKKLGFTIAVLDVRPITGEVMYKSKYAPQMNEWDGYVRSADFDMVAHFIKKAHCLGLEVHASLNVFVAGHNFFDRGVAYTDHPEWASMVYTHDKGIVSIMDQKHKYSAMVNPILPDYQKYMLNILTEFVTKYPKIDGLILDRVRYDGITADFSNFSRTKFEEYINQKIEKFPEDIYEWKQDSKGNYYPERGKHFLKWMEWRTKNIYDFMALARKTVKEANKKVSFGTYTGAWYPSYYEVGVNWASKNYDPSKDYDWATPDYKNYGYMELLDLYTTGNYYTNISMEDYLKNNNLVKNETDSKAHTGTWYCVEGSCEKIRGIVDGKPFYGGILVDQFYEKPGDLTRTIEMNLKKSDGLMVFDIVHVIRKNLWKEVEEGMRLGGNLPAKK